MALVLALAAFGCGDDDSSALRDGGFSRRDAAIDQCVPYYLTSAPCEPERDAGMNAGPGVNLSGLSCERTDGRADAECGDISWDFACGEHLNLVGCCTPQSTCGVIDPTGVLGCISRQVFGASATPCTTDLGMDAGEEQDAAADDDASTLPI